MDDEIKLAGLEALVLEELEQLLILNPNRLRTFEDARLEIVTYVEAKFGLKIRDSKPSGTGSRGHSDPTDVDAVDSLSRLTLDNDHRVRVVGVLCAVDHFFTETAMHARAQTSKRLKPILNPDFQPQKTPNEEVHGHAWESDDWSASHWTDDIESCQPSNTRGSGHWLHMVDWIKSGNRKIQEACIVLWHYDGILPL